jgi:putative ATP-dependent endonuclease of OLD family
LSKYLISVDPSIARLTYQFRPKQSLEGEIPESIEEYEFAVFGGLKDKQVDYDLRNYIHFAILPALRDAESELANWRRSPLRRLLEQLSVSNKRLGKITKALDQVSETLLKVPEIGSLASDIQARTTEMVGTMHGVETKLALASNDPKQLLRSVKLLIDGMKGRQISEASLGTANVLLLSLLLQEMEAKIQRKQLVSLILAIEEPEAHLHPHLQRVLFRYFLRRNHAVIVSSHSPHIASVAPIKSLVVLTKESSSGTKGYAASRLALDEWEEHDLERYFDVTKAEMAFAKGVILVEGIAEEFVIPAFARSIRLKTGERVELDRLGISVCAVHGTDFRPYAKLLSPDGLNIPYVVVTDGDAFLKQEGTVAYPGLKRGCSLLIGTQKDAVEQALANNKWKTARQLLNKAGIFVGSTTLEIDVIGNYPAKAKRAFAELVSEKVAERFGKAVDDLDPGGGITRDEIERQAEVIRRIESIGKGRFAQRLSNKLLRSQGPQYISDAIKHIIEQVLVHSERA